MKLPLSTLLLLLCQVINVDSFVPTVTPLVQSKSNVKILQPFQLNNKRDVIPLLMSYNNNNNDDDGPPTSVVLAGIAGIVIFLAGSIIPGVIELSSAPSVQGSGLGNAIAPIGSSTSVVSDDNEARFEKLSRAQIQEKLNRIPVFYVSNEEDLSILDQTIYLSYEDAVAKAGSSSNQKVKVTTLDQVMYPLVMKRGRMRMAPPPVEVSNAEAKLMENNDVVYKLVPSQRALQATSDLGLTLEKGDVPLFAADRLAFASGSGPEVPLFLEKDDCITSYKRLRSSSSSSKLPEEATVRVTTLKNQLGSMEKGSLPAMRQIQFFSTEYDLVQASQLFQQ